MARPRVEIDPKTFQGLCGIHCTLEEIASVCDCSEDTIERWCLRELKMSFADAYKKYSAGGNASLRRIQFKQAEHNVTMAIWLGKQWLNQTDVVEARMPTAESAIEQIAKSLLNKKG